MTDKTIQLIPISEIRVLNPRVRAKAKFRQIVHNIEQIGLKKPISVSPRHDNKPGDPSYDLVCGQGRLEAYMALGQKQVPAVVVDVPEHDRFLMSLVENIARRHYSSVELMHEISALRKREYTPADIGRKLGLAPQYVKDLLQLLDNGEERLLSAVVNNRVPVSVAAKIATSDDAAIQKALADAYESGKLRGKALLEARRLVEQRRTSGKKLHAICCRRKKKVSADDLVRAYQTESSRQKMMVKKARLCETRLLFIIGALRDLFRDEAFVNLLRAESLAGLPKYLAEQVEGKS